MTDQEFKEQCAALLADAVSLGKRAEALLAEIRAERHRIDGQNDPHKHPLYRPHMGDMTGWRFLEPQETIQNGDEYILLEDEGDDWYVTIHGPDNLTVQKAVVNHAAAYRRRVTPSDLVASSDSPSRTAQTIPPAGPLRAEPCGDAVTLKGEQP